jgi:sensor histidine kinase YesM
MKQAISRASAPNPALVTLQKMKQQHSADGIYIMLFRGKEKKKKPRYDKYTRKSGSLYSLIFFSLNLLSSKMLLIMFQGREVGIGMR